MLLSFEEEVVGLGVELQGKIAFGIFHSFEGGDLLVLHIACFELFKGDLIIKLQEALNSYFRPELWSFQNFLEEHLENHHPLLEMLVVVSTELSLLCDRRDWHSGMQPLKNILEPLKI